MGCRRAIARQQVSREEIHRPVLRRVLFSVLLCAVDGFCPVRLLARALCSLYLVLFIGHVVSSLQLVLCAVSGLCSVQLLAWAL